MASFEKEYGEFIVEVEEIGPESVKAICRGFKNYRAVTDAHGEPKRSLGPMTPIPDETAEIFKESWPMDDDIRSFVLRVSGEMMRDRQAITDALIDFVCDNAVRFPDHVSKASIHDDMFEWSVKGVRTDIRMGYSFHTVDGQQKLCVHLFNRHYNKVDGEIFPLPVRGDDQDSGDQ